MNQHFPIRLPASLKWLSYVLFAASTISSCVKNETYVAPQLYVGYADPSTNPAAGSAYNLRPFGVPILRNSVLYFDSTYNVYVNCMAFPVRLFSNASADNTVNYSKDIPVTATIDTGLLSLYRRLSGFTAPSLPAGAFSLASASVTIKANTAVSTDSIKLIVADYSQLNLAASYVVPIRIGSTVPGIFSPADTLAQTIFFRVSFINDMSMLGPIPGTAGIVINDSTIYMQLVRQSDGTYLNESNASVQLQVQSICSVNFDVTVAVAAMPAQVGMYNAANGSAYTAMPSAGYSLTNSTPTIPAAGFYSNNNAILQFSPGPPPGNYLLPMQIVDIGALVPAPNRNTQYIIAPVEPEVVYTRTGWQIMAVSDADTADNYTAANVLDGNYNSYWQSAGGAGTAPPPQWFVADMGQLNMVNGILFMHAPVSATQQPSQATVYTSTDNVNWDAGQQITIPPMPTPNQFLFIDLASGVQARYIKFEVQSTQAAPAGNVAVAEFGAY
jgi:F5/8 type C domain/Domain of unknown function (DUF1735)